MEVRQIFENQKALMAMIEIDRSGRFVGKKSFEEEYKLDLPLKTF